MECKVYNVIVRGKVIFIKYGAKAFLFYIALCAKDVDSVDHLVNDLSYFRSLWNLIAVGF